MNEGQAIDLTMIGGPGTHLFRLFMPYVFQRLPHPKRKQVFMPLNRDYKPLGLPRSGHVDYAEMAPTHAVVFGRDPASFKDVWSNVRGDSLWLYDDHPRSRLDYFQRLERLMAHKVVLLGSLG